MALHNRLYQFMTKDYTNSLASFALLAGCALTLVGAKKEGVITAIGGAVLLAINKLYDSYIKTPDPAAHTKERDFHMQ